MLNFTVDIAKYCYDVNYTLLKRQLHVVIKAAITIAQFSCPYIRQLYKFVRFFSDVIYVFFLSRLKSKYTTK